MNTRLDTKLLIRALRRRKRMTQEDFSHEFGVAFATVNRWENGKNTPSRLAMNRLRDLMSQEQVTEDELLRELVHEEALSGSQSNGAQ